MRVYVVTTGLNYNHPMVEQTVMGSYWYTVLKEDGTRVHYSRSQIIKVEEYPEEKQ